MQKFVNVRSTAPKVDPLEIDEYRVTINKGITEIDEEATEGELGGGFDGWEIKEQLIYEKDEYIKVIAEKNSSLEAQATDMQIALTEVYEMML